MPVALPDPKRHPAMYLALTKPWLATSRTSRTARTWLDQRGYITPHFTWSSYACSDGTPVPAALHPNAIRFHWDLEAFRHAMGDVPMTVDGPYRTAARNRAVGGAPLSRHVQADAGDFFMAQVNEWVAKSSKLNSRADVLTIADRIFNAGGLGNETSGTLHVDSRGYRSRFVTWVAAT